MKAIQIVKPGELRIIDILVKMRAAGICGSDVGIYHGTNAAATYPRVIGHEMVGVVEEIGSNVKKLKVGDRIIVNQVVSCGECYPCRHNRGNVCDHLEVRGVHRDGGYREYMAVPEEDCYILPDNLSDADSVMIEPTTIAIQSLSRAEIEDDDVIFIIGCGALGSSILRIARLTNAKIIVGDIVDDKLNDALKNGAHYAVNLSHEDFEEKVKEYSNGRGPTVTIDAACTKDSLMNAIKVTGNAGRVITMGFSITPTEVNQFLITSKELDVRGSRLQNKKFGEAIKLINEGKIDLSGAVSHTFNYLDAQRAFDFIDSKDYSIRKIALLFD